MENRELYELAMNFHKTRLWELIDANDLVGIDLGGVTGYVRLYCDADGFVTLLVHPSADALSFFRKAMGEGDGKQSVGLDYLQCTFFAKKALLTPARREFRRICNDLNLPLTDWVPTFIRNHPYEATGYEFAEEDVSAMILVFRVLLKLAAALRTGQKTKKNLGIRTVMTLADANIVETEPGSDKFEAIPFDREVLIPVFQDTPKGFRRTMEALPPYAERAYNPPKALTDPVYTRLLEHEKSGEYDADIIHLPKVQDGDPPYYPEALILMKRENWERADVYPYRGPFIEDTDAFLCEVAQQMLDNGRVPKLIRYRSPSVKTVLKPLCDRVGIKMRKVQYLDNVDFFLDRFDRFHTEDDGSSARGNGKTGPETAKAKPIGRFTPSEIAELEILPVYKLTAFSEEELLGLLTRQHAKLSPGLIRKIFRALIYDR